MDSIENWVTDCHQALEKATSLAEVEALRVLYLGKKGHLTLAMKQLGHLAPEERPAWGQRVNTAKVAIQDALQAKKMALSEQAMDAELQQSKQDLTLPARGLSVGHLHPITQTLRWIQDWFMGLGFEFAEGPEIETDYYNFEALNIPAHHPARAMHDTFYLDDKHLLRTHTSTVQIRYLEKHRPPCRMLSTGRVFRCDYDVSHTPMFHQVEGILIDETAHMGQLKALLDAFLSDFFGKKQVLRFRASYFPFTEPSFEVDIQCTQCEGKGCRLCKGSGWLEVLGCGLMHPNVLSAVQIDPARYRGLAFGLGVERLAMLKYGIPDLRLFFENDRRFLEQF